MTPLNKHVKGSCSKLSHTNQVKQNRGVLMWSRRVIAGHHNFVIYGELFALNRGFYMIVYAT